MLLRLTFLYIDRWSVWLDKDERRNKKAKKSGKSFGASTKSTKRTRSRTRGLR